MVLLQCFVIFGFVASIQALKCRTDSGFKEDELKKTFLTCMRRNEQSMSGNESMTGGTNSFMGSNSRTGNPQMGNPYMGNPQMGRPQTGNTQMGNPQIGNPQMGNPQMANSHGYQANRFGNGQQNGDGMHGMGSDGSSQSEEGSNDSPPFRTQQNPKIHTPTRRFRRQRPWMDRMDNQGGRPQYSQGQYGNSGSNRTQDRTYMEQNKTDENEAIMGKEKDKACVIHCFLQDLQMTGEDGMPDRYKVSHVITKDVKDEDLKDFLQESVEECFQILHNEHNRDKCAFSKSLMTCLAEKGRANCDDWKEDFKL